MSYYGTPFPSSPGIDDGDSLLVKRLVHHGRRWLPEVNYGQYATSTGFQPLGSPSLSQAVTLGTGLTTTAVSTQGSYPDSEALGKRPATLLQGSTLFLPVINTVSWALPVTGTCLASSLLSSIELGDMPGSTLLWYYPTGGRRTYAVHRSRYPRTLDVLSDGDALLRRVKYPWHLSGDRLYCEDLNRGLIYGIWPTDPLPSAPFGSGSWPAIYASLETAPSLLCQEVGFIDTDGLVRVRHGSVAGASAFLPQPDGSVALTIGTVQGNALEVLLGGQRLPYGATVVVNYYVPNSFCITSRVGGFNLNTYSSTSGSATLSLYDDSFVDGLDVNPITSQSRSGFLYIASGSPPYFPAVSGRIDLGTSCPCYDSTSGAGESTTVRISALDNTGTPIVGITAGLSVTGPFSLNASTAITGQDGYAYFTLTSLGAGRGTLTLTESGNSLTTQQVQTSIRSDWNPSAFLCLGEDYRFTGIESRKMLYATILNPDGYPRSGPGNITLTCSTGTFFDPSGLSDASLGNQILVSLTDSSPFLVSPGLVAVGYSSVPGDTISSILQSGDSRYILSPLSI